MCKIFSITSKTYIFRSCHIFSFFPHCYFIQFFFLRQLSRSLLQANVFVTATVFSDFPKPSFLVWLEHILFFFIDGKIFSQKNFFVPISASFFQILFQLPPPFFLVPLFPKKQNVQIWPGIEGSPKCCNDLETWSTPWGKCGSNVQLIRNKFGESFTFVHFEVDWAYFLRKCENSPETHISKNNRSAKKSFPHLWEVPEHCPERQNHIWEKLRNSSFWGR